MKDHDQRIIHSSDESDWRTPQPLFSALSREFCFVVDLAADASNHLTRCWFGPGSPDGEDSFAVHWPTVGYDGVGNPLPWEVAGFLNPPFSRKKARAYRTGRIKDEHDNWIPHPIDERLARVYEVETWAEKCWTESRRGCTIAAVLPFAPQTEWYRRYVYGHEWNEGQRFEDGPEGFVGWAGHAALEERRLPHRISFLQPDGTPTGNAGVNSAIIVWGPAPGIVGPWQPHSFYWSYR